MLLLFLACAPDDGAADDGAPTGDSAAPPFLGPEPATGGTLVAWGNDGVYTGDATGLRRLVDLEPTEVATVVHASGDHVAIAEGVTLRVLPLDGGDVAFTHTLPDGSAVHDLWWHDGGVWVVQGPDLPVLRVDPTGAETVSAKLRADRIFADQGAAYLRLDLGREGSALTPVDAATLEPAGDAVWTGFGATPRGASLYAWHGEIGNGDSGGFTLTLWDDLGADLGVDLPEGHFVESLDAIYGRATLVDLTDAPDWSRSAALLGPDGGVDDTLPACTSPVLRWQEGGLEGWCAAPLRRYTWTWESAGWARSGEETWEEDISHVELIEPGD